MKVYIVEVYDPILEGAYVEPTCYASKEGAIKRAESQTYTDEYGLEHWARWRELKVVERTCCDKNGFDHEYTHGFECTVCEATTDSYMTTTEDTGHDAQFNYCPNCGRRVVEQ